MNSALADAYRTLNKMMRNGKNWLKWQYKIKKESEASN